MTINTEVVKSAESETFVVNGLMITDVDAVDFLNSLKKSERMKAISTAVHFGLLALRDFGTISRMDWIDKRFQSFETTVTNVFDNAREQLDDFLGEHGELDRKFSEVDGPIRSILDPFTEGSPFYDLRRELEDEFRSVRELVSKEAGRREEEEVGTRKGVKFEEELFDFLEPICSKMGDRIKKIGRRKVAGRKVGDLLIVVNEKHLQKPLHIVIEAKAGMTQISGKDGLLNQLDLALDLRKSQYALGVVKVEKGLKGVNGCYSHIVPDKILCTFDPDGLAVEVAYRFARTEILLKAAGEEILDVPTCVAISSKMAEIITKLTQFSNAKTHLTNIESSTREIRKAIQFLQVDIANIVGQIETMVQTSQAPVPAKKKKTGKTR